MARVAASNRLACQILKLFGHRRVLRARLSGATLVRILLLAGGLSAATGAVAGQRLDRMDLDRWAKLREVERYQLQIAEQLYKQARWQAAADEYEKYVTLYERSEGASFAQLKWSICQVKLRHSNTAIKDGFQTVIDYWPDGSDAIKAQYLIGQTLKDMGQLDKAKPALLKLIAAKSLDDIGVMALADLLDIATTEHDDAARATYLKRLTFDVTRSPETTRLCQRAAEQYAQWCLKQQQIEEAGTALATNYQGAELFANFSAQARPWIAQLAAETTSRGQAVTMAEAGAAWCQTRWSEQPGDGKVAETRLPCRLAIIDLMSAADQRDRVERLYVAAEKECGASDTLRAHRAAWLDQRERYEAAAELYRQFDQPSKGLQLLAASYRQRKLTDPAINVYRELAQVDPDQRGRWLGEAAMALREAGQWAPAIEIYRQLMSDDPEHTSNWLWQIGLTHRDARQWKQAIGVLKQCSNFPQHLMIMASCHRHLKQFSEALMLYKQIGSEPAYAAWAAYQIGATWEESGAKEKAIEAFRDVCKRYPKTSQASTAHARLQQVYHISVTLGGALDK